MRSLKTRIADYVKAVGTVATGRVVAGRRLTVFAGDVFIVSYPKSGNTWTRFLIGNLIHQDEPVTFANVEYLVPSIYSHPDRTLRRLPRLLKSHECFDPRYRKIIYIVRDPRDVAVSCYHYYIKMGWLSETCSLHDFVPRFLVPEFEINFGSWSDNVMSWVSMRQHTDTFLFFRYEDMLRQPAAELARVASFLNIEPTPARLGRAVTLSAADRMRELEKKEGDKWTLIKDTRKDKPFVREAKSGGWRKVLRTESVAQIEVAWGSVMERFGYELSTCPAKAQEA